MTINICYHVCNRSVKDIGGHSIYILAKSLRSVIVAITSVIHRQSTLLVMTMTAISWSPYSNSRIVSKVAFRAQALPDVKILNAVLLRMIALGVVRNSSSILIHRALVIFYARVVVGLYDHVLQ